MIGDCNPPRLDFNLYPDLRRRTLKLSGHQGPTSLGGLNRDNGQNSLPVRQMVDFVRYLFETERLSPSTWCMTRLRAPECDALIGALQAAGRRPLSIEW